MKDFCRLVLFVQLLLLSACTYHYGPPMMGKQNLNMAKPHYDSSATSETYASVDIGSHTGYNGGEFNAYLMPGIHQSHAFSFMDISYGVFGYGGGYLVDKIPEEKGIEGFYGGGVRGSANFSLRTDNFEWRVLGIEGAFSRELGEYRQMRSNYSDPDIDTLVMYNTNGRSINFGVSTALVFKSPPGETSVILKGSLGYAENQNSIGSDGIYVQLGSSIRQEKFVVSGNLLLTGGFGGTHFGFNGGFQIPFSAFAGD